MEQKICFTHCGEDRQQEARKKIDMCVIGTRVGRLTRHVWDDRIPNGDGIIVVLTHHSGIGVWNGAESGIVREARCSQGGRVLWRERTGGTRGGTSGGVVDGCAVGICQVAPIAERVDCFRVRDEVVVDPVGG